VKQIKCIDPHVHCRDGREEYKINIRRVTEIFKELGFTAIFDMPNTKPPILTEKEVIDRLKLAEKRKPKVKYFLYVGLTSEEKQIQEAVKLVENYPEVVGLKLYAAEETDQEKIYKILAEIEYTGVLAVHCEKASLFQPELFDPENPLHTHNLARPPEAEIESVEDQAIFALGTGFKGHLHLCHISLPESVDIVWGMKKELNITSAITPYHALLSIQSPEIQGQDSLLYKVNPPLRDRKAVKEIQKRLLEKKIDWIETDFAPHTFEEKLNPPYLSGIASPQLYQKLLAWLGQLRMSQKDIENLTYWNIKRVFGQKLKDL